MLVSMLILLPRSLRLLFVKRDIETMHSSGPDLEHHMLRTENNLLCAQAYLDDVLIILSWPLKKCILAQDFKSFICLKLNLVGYNMVMKVLMGTAELIFPPFQNTCTNTFLCYPMCLSDCL